MILTGLQVNKRQTNTERFPRGISIGFLAYPPFLVPSGWEATQSK